MSLYITIQVRFSSTRLPGKALMKIGKKNILEIMVDRLRKSKKVKDIIVATTTSKADNKIVKFCKSKKIRYFRGPENDVLLRIANCLKQKKIKYNIELYGDSPLIDPKVLDVFIDIFKKKKVDYLTNSMKTTFPPGMEINIYKSSVVYFLNKNIGINSKSREHVISNISRFKNKSKFKILNIVSPQKYRYPHIHFEIDTKKDYDFFKQLNKLDSNFINLDLKDLIKISLKNSLYKINSKVHRRWRKFRHD